MDVTYFESETQGAVSPCGAREAVGDVSMNQVLYLPCYDADTSGQHGSDRQKQHGSGARRTPGSYTLKNVRTG